MATGPEHYTLAEELLTIANEHAAKIAKLLDAGADPRPAVDAFNGAVAAAQVYATLALAAATALSIVGDQVVEIDDDATEWAKAIGAVKLP